MGKPWEAEFAAYYRARGPALRRTGYLLAGSWHDADDLVQATFVKLYVKWPKIRQETADAYARRTLVNEFLSGRRKHRETPTAVLADRAAPSEPVDDRMLLDELLATLPQRQRAMVVLRYWEDLTIEETAELCGVSAGTVKSQVSRALSGLRPRVVPSPNDPRSW